MKRWIGVLVGMAFLLASCGAVTPAHESPSETPAATWTIAPSSTPTPTSSPTAISTATVAIPAATAHTIATLDDLVGRYPDLGPYYFCTPYSCMGQLSPNGEWAAFFSGENGAGLIFVSADGVRRWDIWFRDIYEHSDEYRDGMVQIVHWSADGRYVYVAPVTLGSGGPWIYLGYWTALIRLDLPLGTWTDIGVSGPLAFSPDDHYFVYAHEGIRVRNIQTGQEQIFSPSEQYQFFGKFIWSPDSRRILFAAVAQADFTIADNEWALVLIDLEAGTIGYLDNGRMPFYYPVEWSEPDRVILGKYNEFGRWVIDLTTSRISPLR